MERNNRAAYAIIIAVAIPLVYFTKQWINSQKAIGEERVNHKVEYEFDPETYVDPYGITRCYPSDYKRMEKERMKKHNLKTPAEGKGKYHYHVNLSNIHRDWETYDRETMADGSVRLRKTSSDLSYLNGTYDWYMDLYLPDDDAILSYIIENYSTLKKYKVSATVPDIYDEYNNRLDEYLDDPEDEIAFDPDIFDFLDD